MLKYINIYLVCTVFIVIATLLFVLNFVNIEFYMIMNFLCCYGMAFARGLDKSIKRDRNSKLISLKPL